MSKEDTKDKEVLIMFLVPVEKIVDRLVQRARELASDCQRVFVAVSGGVDSAVVAAILCRAFGSENVVGLFRDIKSNPKHREDVRALQEVLRFRLIEIDANPFYEIFLKQAREQFVREGLEWFGENTQEAVESGWVNAYASLKSRFTTPLAGFIAKAIDGGRGRVFGTGNLEEDRLLRYYDKFGDGAVDNNILNGLTKMEVRQIALFFARIMRADIFRQIAHKLPSADLQANGDEHNDESELTAWARAMGFDIRLSYGTPEQEGNIAWVIKEDMDKGVITGIRSDLDTYRLKREFNYNDDQINIIMFMRKIERATRHKDLGLPGLPREQLRKEKLVD